MTAAGSLLGPSWASPLLARGPTHSVHRHDPLPANHCFYSSSGRGDILAGLDRGGGEEIQFGAPDSHSLIPAQLSSARRSGTCSDHGNSAGVLTPGFPPHPSKNQRCRVTAAVLASSTAQHGACMWLRNSYARIPPAWRRVLSPWATIPRRRSAARSSANSALRRGSTASRDDRARSTAASYCRYSIISRNLDTRSPPTEDRRRARVPRSQPAGATAW